MPLKGFYDPLGHAYYWNGEHWPSVTQILVMTGRIDTRWYSPEGAARGRLVHRGAELYDLALLRRRWQMHADDDPALNKWIAQHEDLLPYLDGYKRFIRDAAPVYSAIERARWSRTGKFGGRPDRGVRRIYGEPAVVEIKTGSHAPWHGVQTAGYQSLRSFGTRYVLYLPGNGTYRLERQKTVNDYRTFRDSLMEVWSTWPQQQQQHA